MPTFTTEDALLLPPLPSRRPPATTDARTVNRVGAVSVQERQTSFAAMGSTLRLTYGSPRIAGRLFLWHFVGTLGYFGYEFGLGETGFDSIIIDGVEVLTAGTHGQTRTIPGGGVSTVTQYHGTSTQIAHVVPGLAGYTDTLVLDADGTNIGVAYLILTLRSTEFDSAPNVEAVMTARKILDPRNGHGSAFVASSNPACILNDLLSNTIYGQGVTVDLDSVEAVADDNDELVPLVTGDARRTLHLALDVPRPVSEWIDVIAGDYAGCFVVPDGDGVKLVSDRPAASSRTFTAADVIQDGSGSSLRSSIEGLSRAPTVVQVVYTDTATEPWSEGVAEALATGVSTNAVPRRVQRVSLPGIQNHKEANRAAIERLNKQTLTRETVSFVARDKAVEQQVGDVVTLTHWRGYSGDEFRLRTAEIVGPGRWRLGLRNYDSNAYSDSVVAGPSQGDGDDIDPFSPTAVASVTAYEEIVQDAGGRMRPQISVEFAAVDWPYVKRYDLEAVGPGQIVKWTAPQATAGDTVVSGALIETPAGQNPSGEAWVVRAYTVSSAGDVRATAATTTLTVKGRYRRPPDVTGLTAVFENGVLTLNWEPVLDLGVVRYRVRFAATDSGWNAAAAGGRLLTDTSYSMREFPADDDDTLWFYVKAQDDVGKRSLNAAKIRVSTIAGIVDTYRTVYKDHYAEDFVDVGNNSTEEDFIYGDAEYWVSSISTNTLANRIGASGAWTNATDEWYMHHPSYFEVPILFATYGVDFDLSTERMARWSSQADWEYYNSSAPSSVGLDVSVLGATYTVVGSENEFISAYGSKFAVTVGWTNTAPDPVAPDQVNDHFEVKMPVRLKSLQADAIQGDTVTGLDETDLDYAITFDPDYGATPRFQFHIICSDVSVIIGLKSLTATTATLHKLAGGATFSWGVSWNSIGQ